MNQHLLLFGLLAECAIVLGQLLLKRAMVPSAARGAEGQRVFFFILSIIIQALYFFLWLGLLQNYPLSSVYPFDAAGPVLLVLVGVLILHERLSSRAWVAITCVIAGLALISLS
jgi:drug/metabolite transporter (DMT)-like permease